MVMVAMDTKLGGTYCAISDVSYFTSIDSHALGFELIRMKPTAYERAIGGLQKFWFYGHGTARSLSENSQFWRKHTADLVIRLGSGSSSSRISEASFLFSSQALKPASK